MSEEEKELLLEMMKFFTFELHRGIKEYGGASNFKTEEACDVIFKILYQYDVNIIDIKTHKDLEKEIERLNNKYNKALELLADYNLACEYDEGKIPDNYCEENCSEDYKKCWNKYIELELKGSDKDA